MNRHPHTIRTEKINNYSQHDQISNSVRYAQHKAMSKKHLIHIVVIMIFAT